MFLFFFPVEHLLSVITYLKNAFFVFCIFLYDYTSLAGIFIMSRCEIFVFYILWYSVFMIFVQLQQLCRWVIFSTAILISPSSSRPEKPLLILQHKTESPALVFLCPLIQLHFKSFSGPLEAGLKDTKALKSWVSDAQEWSDSSHPHKVPECFLSDPDCWIVHYHNEHATKYSFSSSLNDKRAAPCRTVTTAKACMLEFILILTLNQTLLIMSLELVLGSESEGRRALIMALHAWIWFCVIWNSLK